MSKSKGNVITLMDINNKFGADPFRAFMCNSTSVESQFNWESNKVLVMKKHLASLYNILEEIQNNKEDNGLYKKFASYISKTERGIKRATKSLEIMNIRDYSNVILFEFLTNYKYIKGLANEEELKSINNYIGNKWVTLIAPLIPHMAEELWTQKGFVSVANWPKYDESLIDEEAEFSDDFLDTIKADLNSLLKMTKMDNPKKITFLIANNWKFDLMKVFKTELEKTRNFSEILKVIMQTELKQYGKDITKILPSMLKDNSKIPTVVKSPEEEFKIIELAKEALEKKYCSIEVLLADESDNPKGKSALPGKPGIIIE